MSAAVYQISWRLEDVGWPQLRWFVSGTAEEPRLVHMVGHKDFERKNIVKTWLRTRSVSLLPHSYWPKQFTSESGFQEWRTQCGRLWHFCRSMINIPLLLLVKFIKLPDWLKTATRGFLEDIVWLTVEYISFVLEAFCPFTYGMEGLSENDTEKMSDETKLSENSSLSCLLFIYAISVGKFSLCSVV